MERTADRQIASADRPAAALADRLAAPAALLLGLLLFLAFRGHGFDDSYITYRYADNLARGLGLVYNPGERALSTTAPLLALALAPAAALGADLPLVANALSCLAYALGALALYWLGRLGGERLAGAAGGLLYLGYPLFYSLIGGEAALLQALLLWGFVAAAASRPRLAALLLGLATLVRADAALAALCAGLYVAWSAWRGLPAGARGARALLAALPWRAALVYALVVGPWLIFCWAYYGAPLPLTLSAKRRQAGVPGTRMFAEGLRAYMAGLWSLPLLRPLLLLAPLGALAALRRPRWLMPLGWGALHAGAYTALGVPGYPWYLLPALTALLAAAGLGLGAAHGLLRRRAGPPLSAAAAGALLAAVLAGELGGLEHYRRAPDARLAAYRPAGEWLAANSAPGEAVAALEVGVIGYYSRRPMVDFAGLIQPDVADQLGAGRGYADAAAYALGRYRPPLLALSEGSLPLSALGAEAAARCAPAASFPAGITIYRCSW